MELVWVHSSGFYCHDYLQSQVMGSFPELSVRSFQGKLGGSEVFVSAAISTKQGPDPGYNTVRITITGITKEVKKKKYIGIL